MKILIETYIIMIILYIVYFIAQLMGNVGTILYAVVSLVATLSAIFVVNYAIDEEELNK